MNVSSSAVDIDGIKKRHTFCQELTSCNPAIHVEMIQLTFKAIVWFTDREGGVVGYPCLIAWIHHFIGAVPSGFAFDGEYGTVW